MLLSDNLLNQSKITIYTIANCPHCEKAKELLRTTNYSVYDVAVDLKPAVGQRVVERTGQKTWPQIFHGERFIGGYAELTQYLK